MEELKGIQTAYKEAVRLGLHERAVMLDTQIKRMLGIDYPSVEVL